MMLFFVCYLSCSLTGQPAEDVVYRGVPTSEWVKKLASKDYAAAIRALQAIGPRATPQVAEALRDESNPPNVRWWAAFILGDYGPGAKAALTVVKKAMEDRNLGVQLYAARAVWKIDAKAGPAIPVLLKAADDADPNIVWVTAQVVKDIGPQAHEVVPKVLRGFSRLPPTTPRLGDIENDVVSAAVSVGEAAVPPLIKPLGNDSASAYMLAVSALPRIGPKAVPPLVTALADRRWQIRKNAALILGEFRGQAKGAVSALGRALKDEKLEVRVAAAGALWKIDPQSRAGIPVLIDALRAGDPAIRRMAAFTLGEIGPAAREAATELDRAANGQDVALAVTAAVALWKTDGQARVAVLIKGVERKDYLLAVPALKVLGSMGSKAESAVPVMVEALAALTTRMDAVAALASVGRDLGEPVVTPLIRALESDGRPEVRAAAAETLGEIGREALKAISALRRAEHDPQESVQLAAISARNKLRATAVNSISDLIKLLRSPRAKDRRAATDELRELGPKAKEAIPVLIGALNDEDEEVRRGSAEAAATMGVEAVRALVKALSEFKRSRARAAVVFALGEVKSRSRASEPLEEHLKRSKEGVTRSPAEVELAKVTPKLIALLADPSPQVQTEAKYALVKIGATDERAFPAYIAVLDSGPIRLREEAANRMAPFGTRAIPFLIEALKQSPPRVIAAAAGTLGEFGPRANAAKSALIRLLKHGEPDVRRKAMASLFAIGPSPEEVRPITGALKDSDAYVSGWAAQALGKMGAGGKDAVSDLVSALQQGPPRLQAAAAAALGAIGPAAAPATGALRATLKGQDENLRVTALQALAKIRPQSAGLSYELKKLYITAPSPQIRQSALFALLAIAGKDPTILDVLERALQDTDQNIAFIAALNLGEMGPAAAPAIPALLGALKRPDDNVRAIAAQSVVKIGVDNRAIEPFTVLLGDKLPSLRVLAANQLALLRGDARQALGALRIRLDRGSEDPKVKAACAWAIGQIGPGIADDATVRSLVAALKNNNEVRASVLSALGYLAPQSPEVVAPILPELKNQESADVRASAAFALGKIRLGADAAIPALVEALQREEDASVVRFLRDALAEFGSLSAAALADALQSPDSRGRVRVAETLGQIGRGAVTAIPALTAALRDPDQQLALAAAQALGRVAPGVQDSGNLFYLWPLLQARGALAELKARAPQADQFEADAITPVNEALGHLYSRLAVYFLVPLASAGLVVLILVFGNRLRRFLLIQLFRRRWSFVTGSCDHNVIVGFIPGNNETRVALDADGESAQEGFPISGHEAWPPDGPQFQELRAKVRGVRVRVSVAESLFQKPWANVVGGPLSEWDKSAIAGQICLLGQLNPSKRPQVKSLTFAGLGCARPAWQADLPCLAGTKEELGQVTRQFARWGASILSLPLTATQQATIADLSRALTEADVVHVSAHASPQGVFLEDGIMDGLLVQAGATPVPLVDRLRCRLLVLSACFIGDLERPESFVFPIVRRGVNVLAATAPLMDQAAYAFFHTFYRELLPARKAEGVELAQALRRAAADCLPSASKGIRKILWTQGINSFILYGDPSLQLRLRRFDTMAS